MRPRDGYTQNAFAKEIEASAAKVSQWCNGKAIPKDRETLDTAISKLYGKHPDFGRERNKLGAAWEAVVQEKNKNCEEVRRSVAKVQGILLPDPQDRLTRSWTLENVAGLIAQGRLTYIITDQVIRAMKCATIVERSQIVQALVQILVEPTSSQSDWRIKEIAAAILSKVYTRRPTDFEQKALLAMSHRDLASSWASLSVAAPVSIALARAGYPEPLQRSLNKLMLDQEHGRAEFHRGASYYGGEFMLFNGVMDHFRNRRRAGSADLIYAFDTHCLMRLVESPTLPTPHKHLLKPKLLVSANCLYKAGLEEAASCAEKKASQIS
jgi:predicted transcriptional regulator